MDMQQLVSLRWAVRHQFYPQDGEGKQPGLAFDSTLNLLTVMLFVLIAKQPCVWLGLVTRGLCKGAKEPQATTSHLSLVMQHTCAEALKKITFSE